MHLHVPWTSVTITRSQTHWCKETNWAEPSNDFYIFLKKHTHTHTLSLTIEHQHSCNNCQSCPTSTMGVPQSCRPAANHSFASCSHDVFKSRTPQAWLSSSQGALWVAKLKLLSNVPIISIWVYFALYKCTWFNNFFLLLTWFLFLLFLISFPPPFFFLGNSNCYCNTSENGWFIFLKVLTDRMLTFGATVV